MQSKTNAKIVQQAARPINISMGCSFRIDWSITRRVGEHCRERILTQPALAQSSFD